MPGDFYFFFVHVVYKFVMVGKENLRKNSISFHFEVTAITVIMIVIIQKFSKNSFKKYFKASSIL